MSYGGVQGCKWGRLAACGGLPGRLPFDRARVILDTLVFRYNKA